jgi:hypothetical protein
MTPPGGWLSHSNTKVAEFVDVHLALYVVVQKVNTLQAAVQV